MTFQSIRRSRCVWKTRCLQNMKVAMPKANAPNITFLKGPKYTIAPMDLYRVLSLSVEVLLVSMSLNPHVPRNSSKEIKPNGLSLVEIKGYALSF